VLLSRFARSGLSVEAFCRREAISVASFYRWRGLLGERHFDAEEVHQQPAPAFVDLGALNRASLPRSRLDFKLDLGDGLILHLVRS
jgi:putative transposase